MRLGDYEAAPVTSMPGRMSTCVSLSLRTFTEAELKAYYDKLPYADKTTMSPKKHITGAHFTLHDGSKITEGTRAGRSSCSTYYNAAVYSPCTKDCAGRISSAMVSPSTTGGRPDLGAGTYEVKDDASSRATTFARPSSPEQAVTGKIKQNPR